MEEALEYVTKRDIQIDIAYNDCLCRHCCSPDPQLDRFAGSHKIPRSQLFAFPPVHRRLSTGGVPEPSRKSRHSRRTSYVEESGPEGAIPSGDCTCCQDLKKTWVVTQLHIRNWEDHGLPNPYILFYTICAAEVLKNQSFFQYIPNVQNSFLRTVGSESRPGLYSAGADVNSSQAGLAGITDATHKFLLPRLPVATLLSRTHARARHMGLPKYKTSAREAPVEFDALATSHSVPTFATRLTAPLKGALSTSPTPSRESLGLPQPDGDSSNSDSAQEEKCFLSDKAPIAVHCHGGVGRTGVFLLCHMYTLQFLSENCSGNDGRKSYNRVIASSATAQGSVNIGSKSHMSPRSQAEEAGKTAFRMSFGEEGIPGLTTNAEGQEEPRPSTDPSAEPLRHRKLRKTSESKPTCSSPKSPDRRHRANTATSLSDSGDRPPVKSRPLSRSMKLLLYLFRLRLQRDSVQGPEQTAYVMHFVHCVSIMSKRNAHGYLSFLSSSQHGKRSHCHVSERDTRTQYSRHENCNRLAVFMHQIGALAELEKSFGPMRNKDDFQLFLDNITAVQP